MYRRNRREKRGGGQIETALDELAECVSGTDDTERQWSENELKAEINRFLLSLPESRKRMFIMRYWYVDSVSDIAKRLGMSENSVSVALFRIRALPCRFMFAEPSGCKTGCDACRKQQVHDLLLY